jgi:hypothetical protein
MQLSPITISWAQIAHIIDEAVLLAINTDTAIEQLLLEAQQKINSVDIKENNYADSI